jgi:hypothetical protein
MGRGQEGMPEEGGETANEQVRGYRPAPGPFHPALPAWGGTGLGRLSGEESLEVFPGLEPTRNAGTAPCRVGTRRDAELHGRGNGNA